jgi:hypothetical protein
MQQVTLQIRWPQLFGEKPADITPEIRRKRWEEWKALGMKTDAQARRMVKYWSKDHIDESCKGCAHRDKDWCNSFGLPCNVNPTLTFYDNILSMACGGAGFEPKQLTIFNSNS